MSEPKEDTVSYLNSFQLLAMEKKNVELIPRMQGKGSPVQEHKAYALIKSHFISFKLYLIVFLLCIATFLG